MAQAPQQPDLFEWKPKRNLLYRFWNSKNLFWIVYWLFFSPVIYFDIVLLLEFINFPQSIYFVAELILWFIGLTLLFLIIYDLKKPHVLLKKLKSIYFWIIAVLLVSLAYAHYRSVTKDLFGFFADRWLFSSGLITAVLIFLIIKKPPTLIKTLKSKFFWLSFALFALVIFLSYQTTIVSLTSKFWLFPLGIGLVGSSLLAIWKIPLWLNESLSNKKGGEEQSQFELEEKRLKLVDDSRKTVATIIGGLFVVIGAVFTYSNYELATEGQVTNRFSTAVVLLKDEDTSVRLGGLYALERVAKDSPKDHSTVMEILAAYIRERSRIQREEFEKVKSADANKNQSVNAIREERLNNNVNGVNINTENSNSIVKKLEDLPAPVDVLTAIEIIRRRIQENDKENFVFDLNNANLRRASLSRSNLSRVNLSDANLNNANLNNANLSDANLSDANLSEAKLGGANLEGANLEGANLIYANLNRANLRGADLSGANLNRASLGGADLSIADLSDVNLSGVYFSYADLRYANLKYCSGLDFSQISQTIINEATELPPNLEPRRAELLELSKKNLSERNKFLPTKNP